MFLGKKSQGHEFKQGLVDDNQAMLDTNFKN